MPPLARIVGIVLLGVACPTGLAAQAPVPAGNPSAARGLSAPVPDTSWGSAVPPEAAAPAPLAVPSAVRPASFETPVSSPTTPAPQAASSGTALPSPGSTELPLPKRKPDTAAPRGMTVGVPEMLTTASSLAVVLGLFLVFAWMVRRAGPKGSTLLPGEVLEVLGRAPLALRQQVYLIRCGRKLILVHACPDNVETLTEITESEEVDRLLGLCRQSQPNSATAAFRQVFQQFAGEPAASGFLGEPSYDEVRLANAGVARRGYGRQEEDDG